MEYARDWIDAVLYIGLALCSASVLVVVAIDVCRYPQQWFPIEDMDCDRL